MSCSANVVARYTLAIASLSVIFSCSDGGSSSPTSPVDAVVSVDVLAPPAPLVVDETYQLTGVVHTASGAALLESAIQWSSSNPTVAIVEQGLVTARAVGVADILGVSGGKTSRTSIKVVATITSVTADRYADGTIAFTSSRNNGVLDVYVVGPNGLQRVTKSPAHEEFDIWSPDAARIAYIRFPPDTASFSSHIINADGTNDVFISAGLVTWAPDWQHRAVVTDGRLFVSNADGSKAVAVSPVATPDEVLDGPWWSNDGTRLAFSYASSSDLPADIYIVNRDGTGLRNLTNTSSISEEFASWSADGSRLALPCANPGAGIGESVFTVNADGSDFKRLTSTPLPNGDAEPQWSPDGKFIAYTSNVGPNIGIWLIDPTGGAPVRLTAPSMVGGFGNWSRDGTRIAFTGIQSTSFRQNIFVITIDKKSLVQVTSGTGDNLNPFWKP